MIKQLFFDLDGTLLNSRGHVSPANQAAIQKTSCDISLVSARAPQEMLSTVRSLNLTGPQVAFNGGLVFIATKKGYRVLEKMALSQLSARVIMAAVMMYFPRVGLSYYDQFNWYVPHYNDIVRQEQARNGLVPRLKSPAAACAEPSFKPLKIMLTIPDAMLVAPLQSLLAGLNLPDIAVQQSGHAYGYDFIEITHRNAQKAHGVQFILRQKKLSASAAAAFGDGQNDLPMLKSVGLPIVMENATPVVQAQAAFVTKSNDADGVAHALFTHPALKEVS